MRTITIAGPGAQRGNEFGRLEASDIASAAAALKSHLARAGHSPESLGRRLAASPLCRTAQTLTPDLWSEVLAIASGSRSRLEDVLLLTFLDEVWALTGGSGCSTIARVAPTGLTEIGQTMDLPSWTAGRSLVIRTATDTGPAALVMSYPGMIGLCGANIAGLGVAVNALGMAPIDESGLGVAFVTRHLLTLTSLDAARQFLRSVPHAVGQAYTVAAPDGIATFEAGPAGVEQVSPPDASDCVHTNHPLAHGSSASQSSRLRLVSLTNAIGARAPLADALSGEVVLDGQRLGDPNVTFAAFRFVVGRPEARFIDGASLRSAHHEWTRIPFR